MGSINDGLRDYVNIYAYVRASYRRFYRRAFSLDYSRLCTGMVPAVNLVDQSETIKEKQVSLFAQVKGYSNLFRNKQFWFYALILGFTTACYFCFLTGAPIISDIYFKISPSTQGYFFAIPGIGFLLGNYLTGRFTIRFGTKKMMIWGCFIALIGPLIQFFTLSLFNSGALGLFGPMFFWSSRLTLPNAAAGIVSWQNSQERLRVKSNNPDFDLLLGYFYQYLIHHYN